jgi:hypothetical protein
MSLKSLSLKSLSLNFEQLENKIALSALPNSGYRDLGRKAHPTQQIVRQAKKPPLQIQTVPFNAIKPTVAINTNESKLVFQNQPAVKTTTIVPIKFVQSITPDGNIRCQPVNNALNQTIQPKQTQVTNITMDKIPEIFFVMRIGKDGVAYCERIETPNLTK